MHFGYPASLQALDPLKYLEHNRIENPYWQEATMQLAIYKRDQGFELATTENKSNKSPEED